MFTDSHIHLYLEQFDSDLNFVIQEAVSHKINRFLLPNIDNKTLPKLLSTCNKYPDLLFPMIGLHPCSVNKNYLNDLELLYSNITNNNFIAIGEVGIDLYWEKKFIKEQKEAFKMQIHLANKHKLPIIIHCRNAFHEIYSILKKEKNPETTGIFHCFSGSYQEAKKIIDLGFYLGIGGVLTFKNSGLIDVIKKIDLKHIVLETDAPYLAPHPMRGKRNEPKFLSIIAEKITHIKNVTAEQLSRYTNKNIDDIFFKNPTT
ncbi:MAG: hydrolase TatD [Flavobacteriales bacterium]|nr:hydrolase TatD [Flavobacteriales bacterium]